MSDPVTVAATRPTAGGPRRPPRGRPWPAPAAPGPVPPEGAIAPRRWRAGAQRAPLMAPAMECRLC